MANTNTKRIVADGPKNAVVELMGVLDTSAATFTVIPAIDISVDFVNNDPTKGAPIGLRLDEIQYSLSDGLSARLSWNATADELMVAIAGHDRMCFKDINGLQPNRAAAGYDGDVNLEVNNIVVTAGTPIQVYTLVLSFTKLYTLGS